MKLTKSSRIYWQSCFHDSAYLRTALNRRSSLFKQHPHADPPPNFTEHNQAFTNTTCRRPSHTSPNERFNSSNRVERTDRPIETSARAARQEHRDYLPEGLLNTNEHNVYERLYGAATVSSQRPAESNELRTSEMDDQNPDQLFIEGKDGLLKEIELNDEELYVSLPSERIDRTDDILGQETFTDQSIEGYLHNTESNITRIVKLDNGDSAYRSHPFTVASRSGANSSTLELPNQSFVTPVTNLLADVANKHIDEASSRSLGGPGLPYGTAAPAVSRTLPQNPIPLSSSHARMSEIEADIFLATIMPGTYAAVASVLKEIRKRMGSVWLESLLHKDGGPKILDIGSGGAGVIAWREVLTAEWNRIKLVHPLDHSNSTASPPLGKATVVVGSSTLRRRSANLLENTTFLPRLPDYVHTHFNSSDAHRKQFDIIIAPHSLWNLQQTWERRQRVLNFWNLLSSDGVLLLLEKGVPRGFEVIADARQYLLDELFSDTHDEQFKCSAPLNDGNEHQKLRTNCRSKSCIIAPCPHTSSCPLYANHESSRRKDYCSFKQRYFRPPFYQRILGAKHKNHEDVEFSYIAVQKARLFNADLLHGRAATERAFQGYDVEDEDLPAVNHSTETRTDSQELVLSTTSILPGDLPLPRAISTPLKRHGHVHLDLCTPSGTVERWTVPKSFGKQPYRDARKARWGDLWALGAKQRELKRLRIGKLKSTANTDMVIAKESEKASQDIRKEKKG